MNNDFLNLSNIDLNNTYVISDVHGCYYSLMDLIDKLPKNANLIFVGDLIDKGAHNIKTVEYVINNKHLCVLGNHENFFINYIIESVGFFIENKWNTNNNYGGKQTVNEYLNKPDLVKKHFLWVENLPLTIKIDNFLISHAFVLPYYKRIILPEFKVAILNNRMNSHFKKNWEIFDDYNIINIFGHDTVQEVIFEKNYIAIDTGCVYNKKLTALRLSDLSLTQVNKNIKDVNEFDEWC